jgi:hypothetical protein
MSHRRSKRKKREVAIPLRIVELYMKSVEALLRMLPDTVANRERITLEGRTRFLRELINDLTEEEDDESWQA